VSGTEPARDAARREFLAGLQAAVKSGLVTQADVLGWLANECGLGADEYQLNRAQASCEFDDEHELAETPLISEADDGFWVLSWTWIANPEFVNHYHCDACEEEWQDTWSCACNDRCPVCNQEIQPYKSEEV